MALSQTLAGATSFEDLLVRAVVNATRALQQDEHLRLMLATEPGEVVHELTVHGLPVILRVATDFLTPWFAPLHRRRPLGRARRAAQPPRHLLLPRPLHPLRPGRSCVRRVVHRAVHHPCLRRAASRPLTAGRERNRVVHRRVAHRSDLLHRSHVHRDDLGRADLNDIEAILSVANTDVDEISHAVADNADAIFTWDYSLARPALRKLYEKAKTGQWNATTDLPWDTEVDLEKVVAADQVAIAAGLDPNHYEGTGRGELGRQGVARVRRREPNWTLSQFMHGEQGALLCTAKIVETVPWYDAKLYASTQVMDEARHVEVFARYLDEKLGGPLPDQRPPADAARRHRQRQPLGHDLPGHADHGGGPRPGRLRLHAPDDQRAAPQAAPPLRDERRGPPRGLRRAVAARRSTRA